MCSVIYEYTAKGIVPTGPRSIACYIGNYDSAIRAHGCGPQTAKRAAGCNIEIYEEIDIRLGWSIQIAILYSSCLNSS